MYLSGFTTPGGTAPWDSYPIVVPAGGLVEKAMQLLGYPAQLVWNGQWVPVTPTVTTPGVDRGGVATTGPNPKYAPPGAVRVDAIMAQFKSGEMKSTLPPMSADTQAEWQRQRSTIGPFQTYTVGANSGQTDRGGVYGATPGTSYATNPQNWLNWSLSTQYGYSKNWLGAKNFMDRLSDGVFLATELAAAVGIGYGLALTAAAATAAPAATAPAASSAVASDAGMLYAPAAAAAPAAAPAAVSAATTATTATTAAGAVKTAAGLVAQAKEIIGVASAIRAVASKPGAAPPAPSLDSEYGGGAGSGGGAGGSGSYGFFDSLLADKTSLYVGGAILLALLAVSMSGKKKGRA